MGKSCVFQAQASHSKYFRNTPLTPSNASEPGVWFAGTSPQALFRSHDSGISWEPVPGFNEDPEFKKRMGGEHPWLQTVRDSRR